MKKSILSIRYFLALLILLAINSCKKEILTGSGLDLDHLRTEFEQKKFSEKVLSLAEPINNDQIIWNVDWDAKSLKINIDSGLKFIYVPLTPRLVSGRKLLTHKYHRFLLITKNSNVTHYYLAYTYNDNLNETDAPGRVPISGFTGTLQLKDLESSEVTQYAFSEGNFSGHKRAHARGATMEECVITYRCSWGTVCSGAIVYVTATEGTSCQPPMFDPCGNSNDQLSWSLNGSYEVGRTCFPVSPPVDPPTPGGGGGGTLPGDPNPTDPNLAELEPSSYTFPVADPADLTKQFECFKNIPDAGATYTISINVDLPVNDIPNKLVSTATVPPSPGHAWITLMKTGAFGPPNWTFQSVSKSFGFYPSPEVLSLALQAVGSKIVDDGGRELNAEKFISLTEDQFDHVMQVAIYLAGHKAYDINDYNCADYAIDVWNSVANENLTPPDWIGPTTGINYGTTPNGLYKLLSQQKAYGANNISVTPSSVYHSAPKTAACKN